MSEPVLIIKDLCVDFATRRGPVHAVSDVSLTLRPGEILGLVGESGSGKTVTGLAILGLIDAPGKITAGSIQIEGREIVGVKESALRSLRGKKMAMIFQDPMNTLHPMLSIETQMVEAIRAHEKISIQAARARALTALSTVGIPAAKQRLSAYPHQLSGGMRQRVAIAIAMLHRPTLLVADEPTTALDVTIQAQILSQIQKLCAELGTALIWITHDLAVVAALAHSIAVMYAGRIVETGSIAQVLDHPNHPYTAGLLDSSPSRNTRGQALKQIPGIMQTLMGVQQACAFAPRCSRQQARCLNEMPIMEISLQQHAHRWFYPLTTEATAL